MFSAHAAAAPHARSRSKELPPRFAWSRRLDGKPLNRDSYATELRAMRAADERAWRHGTDEGRRTPSCGTGALQRRRARRLPAPLVGRTHRRSSVLGRRGQPSARSSEARFRRRRDGYAGARNVRAGQAASSGAPICLEQCWKSLELMLVLSPSTAARSAGASARSESGPGTGTNRPSGCGRSRRRSKAAQGPRQPHGSHCANSAHRHGAHAHSVGVLPRAARARVLRAAELARSERGVRPPSLLDTMTA